MITICLTYFRSLTLANLAAALYSVRRQDLSHVESMLVLDNNTSDAWQEVRRTIDELTFPIRVDLLYDKRGERWKTHAWSTNAAVRAATTPWVLFTRADYLLDFMLVRKFVAEIVGDPQHDTFVTAHGSHLSQDIEACEQTDWRLHGPRFQGTEFDYTHIDAGVWMARRDAFNRVGGLSELLTAWGHAQTEFQYRLYKTGTHFVRVPEVLFYHPQHGGHRDMGEAHKQLHDLGLDARELWARYEGANPYA